MRTGPEKCRPELVGALFSARSHRKADAPVERTVAADVEVPADADEEDVEEEEREEVEEGEEEMEGEDKAGRLFSLPSICIDAFPSSSRLTSFPSPCCCSSPSPSPVPAPAPPLSALSLRLYTSM